MSFSWVFTFMTDIVTSCFQCYSLSSNFRLLMCLSKTCRQCQCQMVSTGSSESPTDR
jgi:hypothetical protein